MDRRFYRSVLSAAITVVLFPGVGFANPVIDGDKITWLGDKSEYKNAILEGSGNKGIHTMVVQDYNLVDFHEGSVFKKMWVKSAVSLGGGNGDQQYPADHQPYGDLHLSVLGSAIKGKIADSWFWTGLYARSDSEGANVTIVSDSTIDLAISMSGNKWIQGGGIYAEHKGEAGHSTVVLNSGSDITLSVEADGAAAEFNAGVVAYSNNGKADVFAEKGTSITTHGFGVAGIKTYSGDGSTVIHAGTLNNNSDSGRGILSHAIKETTADMVIANLEDGEITMTGLNATGIKAYSEGAGNIEIYNAGKITLTEGWDGIIQYPSSSGMYMQTHAADGIIANNISMKAINDGVITTHGTTSEGMQSQSAIDSGLIGLANHGDINIHGIHSSGMVAMSSQRENGDPGKVHMQLVNTGNINLGDGVAWHSQR